MRNSIGNNGERSQNVLGSQSNDYGSRSKIVRKKIFTLNEGELFTRRDITDSLEGISKQLFAYVIKELIYEGVVKQKGHGKPRLYRLNKSKVKLFSYSKTTKTEYMGSHHLYITIPRLPSPEVKLPSDFWNKVNDRLKNNVQKFKRMEIKDYSLSIRQTNNKVIIQSNEPVMLEDLNDLTVICLGFVWEMWGMLLDYDYRVDPSNAKVEDPELFYTNGTVDHIAKSHPNPKLRIYLDGVREKILASDQPKQKWVQFCLTPKFRGMHWIESNDKGTLIDWKNLPTTIAQQNQDLYELKQTMGSVARDTTRSFNANLVGNSLLREIRDLLGSGRVRKARKIIRPLNWWLR